MGPGTTGALLAASVLATLHMADLIWGPWGASLTSVTGYEEMTTQ
jgi:hypothetical protein